MPTAAKKKAKPRADVYAVAPSGPGEWRVGRVGTPGYLVRRDPWRCKCPAFAWGHGKPCKHVRMVKDTEAFMSQQLRPEPTAAAEAPPPDTAEATMKALSAPFDPSEVKFKPAVVAGARAMALAYVDARVIQDRLDEVLGVTGWQDEYEVLPDNSVVCRLKLKLGGEWITKVDVGGPSEQPDGGDRMKAAFSDALKRSAVKFGVGRYLYRLPQQWVDYDPQKRLLLKPPVLPPWALPEKPTAAATAPTTPRPPVPGKPPAPPAPAPKPATAPTAGVVERHLDRLRKAGDRAELDAAVAAAKIVLPSLSEADRERLRKAKAEALKAVEAAEAKDAPATLPMQPKDEQKTLALYLDGLKLAPDAKAFTAVCDKIRAVWSGFSTDEKRQLNAARDAAAARLGKGDELAKAKANMQAALGAKEVRA